MDALISIYDAPDGLVKQPKVPGPTGPSCPGRVGRRILWICRGEPNPESRRSIDLMARLIVSLGVLAVFTLPAVLAFAD